MIHTEPLKSQSKCHGAFSEIKSITLHVSHVRSVSVFTRPVTLNIVNLKKPQFDTAAH